MYDDTSATSGLTLLTIPPEIRENIYRRILNPDVNRVSDNNEYTDYDYREAFVLFKINRQIYYEARKVFRDLNVFVSIETPWPEASDHVALDGHVPILMKGERAEKFREHSLAVTIEAPINDPQPQSFVILSDDLEKFTRSWFYADLSHPGLNQYLQLKLQLRDPYSPEWEEKRMPKWKQEQLLMPFRLIKCLGEMVVNGDPKPYASIEKEIREEQARPYDSPESCLREATRLKVEGNTALNSSRYSEALKLYNQAWEALHIVVKGRARHIHAGRFFDKRLVEAPYVGKHGETERLLLRVQLVANTVLVYIKLEQWREAHFWGYRTISMFREGFGFVQEWQGIPPEDEAVVDWVGAEQMGKIYFRTGLACKELGDKDEARRLLRVAAVYLPNDRIVRRELTAVALRI